MTNEAKRCVVALRTKCREEGSCDACGKKYWCYLHGDEELSDHAADLIESLSAELEQVKRERDAAVMDINMLCMCDVCTRSCKYDKPNPYCECADFEWRGVKE